MNSNKKRSRLLWDEARKPNAPTLATVRAILYELQPIQFSTMDMDIKPWFIQAKEIIKFIQLNLPRFIRSLISFLRKLKMKHWIILISMGLYWQLVKWIHRKLDAGPIFIMITIMLLIFTIGLGDSSKEKREEDGEEHWSAYSAFNRGCQSLLGAINVDDLVAQHIGGGLHMGFRQDNNHHDRDHDNDFEIDDHRRRRRPGPPDDDNFDANGNLAVANNQARKSGKKLRRKNLELRRETQRQRQAAAALGFGGFDETEAMNQLLDEQAAAIEQMEVNNENDGNLAAILAALED